MVRFLFVHHVIECHGHGTASFRFIVVATVVVGIVPRNTTTSHTRHSSYLLLLLLLLLLFELVSISESGWWQVRTIIVTNTTPERPTTARSNHGAVSRVVFAHWPGLFHETGRGVRG